MDKIAHCQLCLFFRQYRFSAKPENLVKPERLEWELDGAEYVTHRIESLQGWPDTPAVVLTGVDQDGYGVVENTHHKEEKDEDNPIEHVEVGFSQTELKEEEERE